MNCRHIYAVAVFFLSLAALANVANAQSQNKENPTPLTSDKMSSTVHNDDINQFFYYSFMAGPGDVTISLNVEPDLSKGGWNEVRLKLLTENGDSLSEFGISTWRKAQRDIRRITLRRRQKLRWRFSSLTITIHKASMKCCLVVLSRSGRMIRHLTPKQVGAHTLVFQKIKQVAPAVCLNKEL